MLKYDRGIISQVEDEYPQEYPLKLRVNGRELATLVASPHDLHFLVAGFLLNQGFVSVAADILAMGICKESGEANVRIRGEVPDKLSTVLTSGCGTGISFSLLPVEKQKKIPGDIHFSPSSLFEMMRQMGRLSERYGKHGGIHSAAVTDGKSILFHAEDLGRHNTIDRIAGMALLNNVSIVGTLLMTSGRISAEMAAKGVSLGVAALASRTSPTDMAVRICRERGVGLACYVRGGTFRVVSREEMFTDNNSDGMLAGITGVILAGGASSRMGENKALLQVHGEPMILSTYRVMASLFPELLVVTNRPELFDFLPCRKVQDIYPGFGPLAGIHAALSASRNDRAFVVACDMPTLSPALINELCSMPNDLDVVIPETAGGLEPLHSVYSRRCIPTMEEMLLKGEYRILSFFEKVRIRLVPRERIALLDPAYSSFSNINTPGDYGKLLTDAATDLS